MRAIRADMLSRDLYAILGVSADASDEEVEEAYRHLSRRYHPGINPGDAEAALAFERIEAAYQALANPESRAEYDGNEQAGPPQSPVAATASPISVEAAEGEGGSFRHLFSDLRDHAARSHPRRGEDLHARLTVPLLQAERGRRTAIEVRRLIHCHNCRGQGRLPGRTPSPCSRCHGTGNEVFSKGALSVTCRCADCAGDGLQYGTACPQCHGSGLASSTQAVPVQTPAGAADGQVLRLPGLGHHGPQGGPPGDLLITCHVQAHPGFERHGPNLHFTVKIAAAEAVLGARVPVPVPTAPDSTLRIPPGTQNGQVFHLRGRGLPMSGGRQGDLVITAELWVPAVVDEDAKALIREFGERTGSPPRLHPEHDTVKS
jgi:molecular chaperone DnaJ